ncbi:hypothetical protein EI94DRAFT_1726101 [Lactarius quietus]|nr:hypothetical protein EI94DRAFT_1726101 [Lactarius quietus]
MAYRIFSNFCRSPSNVFTVWSFSRSECCAFLTSEYISCSNSNRSMGWSPGMNRLSRRRPARMESVSWVVFNMSTGLPSSANKLSTSPNMRETNFPKLMTRSR